MKKALLALVVLFAGIQFVRPAKTNPREDPEQALPAPPRIAAILERGCRDCHSNRTQWPWYSDVAPVSWFVRDHVNHARSHLNFSQWKQYPPDRGKELLDHICKEVSSGAMPISSYLYLHRDARLSAADRQTLCKWTRTQIQPSAKLP